MNAFRWHSSALASWALAVAVCSGANFSFAQEALDQLERMIEEAPAVPLVDEGAVVDEVVPDDALPAIEEPAVEPAPSETEQPGYLGVLVDDRRGVARGVPILDVRPSGPADVAGLEPGDLIIGMAGQPVTGIDDFAELMGVIDAGQTIAVDVFRNGARQSFTATLTLRSDADAPPLDDPLLDNSLPPVVEEEATETPQPRPILGVRVVPVQTSYYRISGRLDGWGALITEVVPGSPAEKAGLPRGAIITALNGFAVSEPDDLFALMQNARLDRPIELRYEIGGQSYQQVIPLTDVAQGTVVETPLPKSGTVIEAPPRAEPPPIPRPPVDPFAPAPKTPTPAEAAPLRDDKAAAARLEELQQQLDDLRLRAVELEETIRKLRSSP